MTSTLVIGDPHTHPNEDQRRFDILGRFIVDHQPDNIVQIGDFLTYDSISAWNRSKRLTMEGKRLGAEMQAGSSAYGLIMQPMRDMNESRRTHKRALYKPNMFWIEGNHEDRALRYAENNPELADIVDYRSYFDPEADGWVIVPYREHCEVSGVLFTHAPMSGNNQPLSSKHLVKNVIKDYAAPLVFGHTHKLAYECDGVLALNGGKRITALNVGCYFDEVPNYAEGSRGPREWWAGLVMLHHTDAAGGYDLATYSLDFLKEHYQ